MESDSRILNLGIENNLLKADIPAYYFDWFLDKIEKRLCVHAKRLTNNSICDNL